MHILKTHTIVADVSDEIWDSQTVKILPTEGCKARNHLSNKCVKRIIFWKHLVGYECNLSEEK